jgi:hypothetical protein
VVVVQDPSLLHVWSTTVAGDVVLSTHEDVLTPAGVCVVVHTLPVVLSVVVQEVT